MIGDQSGVVFSNVTAFENGKRVMIEVDQKSKWQRSLFGTKFTTAFLSVFGPLCLFQGFFFILQCKKHHIAFVLCVCICIYVHVYVYVADFMVLLKMYIISLSPYSYVTLSVRYKEIKHIFKYQTNLFVRVCCIKICSGLV